MEWKRLFKARRFEAKSLSITEWAYNHWKNHLNFSGLSFFICTISIIIFWLFGIFGHFHGSNEIVHESSPYTIEYYANIWGCFTIVKVTFEHWNIWNVWNCILDLGSPGKRASSLITPHWRAPGPAPSDRKQTLPRPGHWLTIWSVRISKLYLRGSWGVLIKCAGGKGRP